MTLDWHDAGDYGGGNASLSDVMYPSDEDVQIVKHLSIIVKLYNMQGHLFKRTWVMIQEAPASTLAFKCCISSALEVP